MLCLRFRYMPYFKTYNICFHGLSYNSVCLRNVSNLRYQCDKVKKNSVSGQRRVNVKIVMK